MNWINPTQPLSPAVFPMQVFGSGWFTALVGRNGHEGIQYQIKWCPELAGVLDNTTITVPRTFHKGAERYNQRDYYRELQKAWENIPYDERARCIRYLKKATLAAFLLLTKDEALYMLRCIPAHMFNRPQRWPFDISVSFETQE